MNLHEFHARQVPNFVFGNDVTSQYRDINGAPHLGLTLPPAATPQIIIQNVFGHRPLRSFPPSCGWFATGTEGKGKIVLRLRAATGNVLADKNYLLTDQPTLLDLPWPALGTAPLPECHLEIHVPANSAPVFLAISKTLDRRDVSGICRGRGVEIGPGVTPQILPGPDIDVAYAEEKNREDWLHTYAYKLDKYKGDINALPWERYHATPANALPAVNDSLDFIFASHLLEHVVNPLGHFEHWLSKLKPGGIIAGILPHCDNSVDYQMFPTMLPTVALEYQRKETRPNLNHYRTIFGMNAEARMKEGRTLHVHFYNERNLQDVLSYAMGILPIAWFRMQSERNYKEFFFVIGKK